MKKEIYVVYIQRNKGSEESLFCSENKQKAENYCRKLYKLYYKLYDFYLKRSVSNNIMYNKARKVSQINKIGLRRIEII